MKDTPSLSVTDSLSRSNLAAQFSEQMAIAAIPILAVVALGVTAEQSAALQAINTLPFLLLSIPAGLLADRIEQRRLMVATELVRAAALFLLFACFQMRVLSFYGLSALGFAIAAGTVVYSVTVPALVAAQVAKSDLLLTNRQLEIARSIAFAAGPSVGGVLASWASGAFAFLAAFCLSLASAWYMSKLPAHEKPRRPQRHIAQELSEGINFIIRNPHLRPIVLTSFVFNTSWYLLLSIFAYDAVHRLELNASAIGAALGTYGVGMVTGALLYKPVSRRLYFGGQIIAGPLCAAAAACLVASTLITLHRPSIFIAFFLFGLGPILWTISTTSLRQIITPNGLIARVSSVIMTATFGARPLGALLGSWLSASYGVTSCLIGVAIGFSIQLAIISTSVPARVRSVDMLMAVRS